MKLPEAVRMVGVIEQDRVIYIEDYVLQYLNFCKEKRSLEKQTALEQEEILLYGRKRISPNGEVFIIYGACPEKRQQEGGQAIGHFDSLGRVDMEIWGREANGCQGILIGEKEKEKIPAGYYIFYDGNEEMKEYLGRCYTVDRGKREASQRLQSVKVQEESLIYIPIRIAVLCILTIICAMAVTTVNRYGSLEDFIQKAVYTSKPMEAPAEVGLGE